MRATPVAALLLAATAATAAAPAGAHRGHHLRDHWARNVRNAQDSISNGFSNDFKCVFACLTAQRSGYVECLRCVETHLSDVVQVPPSYAKDMLAFKLTDQDYISGWCGKHALHPKEGVDIKVHPTGWREVVDAAGNVTGYTGCERTTDFPGLGTVSHQSHAYVREQLAAVPRRQEAGEIWRGNELGFIVMNSLVWEGKVNPRALLLGSTPQQHTVVRPVLERVFGACGSACAAGLRESAADFIGARDVLAIQADVQAWVFEELFKRSFPGEANPIPAAEFVATQGSFLTAMPLLQLVPDFVGKLMAKDMLAKIDEYFQILRPLTEKHYGAELAGQDCGATEGGCVSQMTMTFIDTLLSAGGLSVPGGISTALWVVYGETASHGDTFPADFVYDRDNVVPFYYESLRFFAPVVGFPWWEPAPERATNDFGSQFKGGRRTVLNLALAGRDPNVWGADAHKFRVRTLGEYHAKFIGFAEPAVDASVAGGAMNRACPAKELGLQMGKAFLQAFDQSEWEVLGEVSKMKLAAPFIDSFTLGRVGSNATAAPASGPQEIPFQDFFVELLSALDDPDVLASVGDVVRFDLYTRGLVKRHADYLPQFPKLGAGDVAPANMTGFVPSVPCGLAEDRIVPMVDETWPAASNKTAEESDMYARVLPFPHHAAMCGEWNEGEDQAAVLSEMMRGGVSQERVLVPWGEERYTDAGFSALVFQGVGQHRVEKVRAGDAHAAGATYAVYLGFAEALEVKPGFARYGADAYFNAEGQVTHIRRTGRTYYPSQPGWEKYTSTEMSWGECREVGGWFTCWWNPSAASLLGKTCLCKVPARVGFRSAKMAFLGTLSAVMSTVDHLYALHLTVGNSIVTANVQELAPEHPLRVLMHPFTFRTTTINWQAAFALVDEFGLLHRSTALTADGMRELFLYAQTEAAGVTWAPVPERHAAQGITAEDKVQLPLHEDGADFYAVVKKYIRSYLSAHYDYASNACGADEGIRRWHARVNAVSPNHDLPKEVTCEHMEELLATFVYYVTAGHTHAGAIGAELVDPCHSPWAWREGELCATPRTAFTQMLVLAVTSLEQPKLLDDYTHLFPEEADKQLWRDFQADLVAFGKRVDERNANRARPFRSFDVRVMEVSIGI